MQELMVIALIAVIVIGPKRLPELARDFAKVLAKVRAELSESLDAVKTEVDQDGLGDDLRAIRRELAETQNLAKLDAKRQLGLGPSAPAKANGDAPGDSTPDGASPSGATATPEEGAARAPAVDLAAPDGTSDGSTVDAREA